MPQESSPINKEFIFAYSTRQLQNMSLAYGELRGSLENRKNFLAPLKINYEDLVCARQVHASHVHYAREEDRGSGALAYDTALAETDALVTDRRSLPLAIFIADCLAVFLYDRKNSVIGLVHAGWRSSRENITKKTIQFMQKQFHTESKDLYLAFGPAIRSCCYEVKEEFRQFFPEFLIRRDNRYYLDLARVNQEQAEDAGVDVKNISDPQICTFCQNENFFSFRREGDSCGRLMCVAMLV
jgi:hypothetical protein